MSSAPSIAPRAVAEDVAAWYLSQVDRSVSHGQNVRVHLRQAMMVLTRMILFDEEEQDDFVGGGGSGFGGSEALDSGDRASEWRSRLDLYSVPSTDSLDNSSHGGEITPSSSPKSASDKGPRLSRRSAARLRAFLTSCRLAVPDDPFPVPGTTGGNAGSNSGANGSGVATLRHSEAKKAAAAADTAARQLLGKPLHESKPKELGRSKPQVLTADSRVASDASSLEAALSGFSVSAAAADKKKGSSPKKQVNNNAKRGKNIGKGADGDLKRQTSTASAASRRAQRYPQFEDDDLNVRVELYVRSLRRVRETGDECVINLEPPRAIRARVGEVVDSFIVTVGCVRSIGPVLSQLVGSLTKELLAVEVLGEEISAAIRRLASTYEHETSFASLAFLSTPEDAAGTHLTPLLVSYVQYLQSDWERLVALCELESMLSRTIDPETRQMFKTIEFQSIGHLLDVCHQNRSHLQNIMLPKIEEEQLTKQVHDPKLLKQAMKDVRREIITVNGHVLPPAKNLKDLIKLLTEALNSKPLTLSHDGKKRKSTKKRASKKAPFLSVEGAAAAAAASEEVRIALSMSESDLSSGCEGDADSDRNNKAAAGETGNGNGAGKSRASRRRSTIAVGAIEYMTRRILVAASRTGTGGDAYFVVRDLFGGEDVEVLPSSSQPTYSSSRPGMTGRAPRRGAGGTIELIVRLSSVTIKCHGCYDVYPKPFVEGSEPLIQLHTNTEEMVSMHEVRSTEGNSTILTLKEKKTDTTGNRSLSIRPALYEKVVTWNTPS